MTVQFKIGQSYATRSSADYDTVLAFEILRRTDQFVWIKVRGEEVRRKVRVIDGVEMIDPHGRYSLSPVLSADKTEHDVLSGASRAPVKAPRLHPYQEDALKMIIHRHELVEQPRRTTAAVVALKVSSTEIAGEVRRAEAVRMLTRFFAALPGASVSREQVGSFLDIIAGMTDENFDDLDLIRQYLRGE